MATTCPNSYLPPGCWDITKQAGSDATLAGLLATIAAAAIILVLQAPKRSSFERETRNTVLSVLVSTFLSALLASFVFGLLTGEQTSIRADVLINLSSPALVVGVLQFLLSIGWLLTSHQAEEATRSIARWAFLLVNGLVVVYLALDWENLLELKTPGAVPAPFWTLVGVLGALLMAAVTWAVTTRLKLGFSSEASKRREEGASYAHRCAKSGLFFAAGSALIYGVISDFSASTLQDWPGWIYYLGVFILMVLMTWFVCVSEMSWPPLSPAPSSAPQRNHTAVTLDHNLSGETMSAPLQESTTSAKKRSIKKPTNLGDKNSNGA